MTSTANLPAISTFEIDPTHTLVEFSAKHMMITTVKGRIPDVRGTITMDAERPDASSVIVEFGAASIDTAVAPRDQHLRSADFLDVERYPLITFHSRRIEGIGGASVTPGDTFRIVGDLMIRDQTREVTLDATFEGEGRDPWGGDRISFSARTKIDRRDFGLTWNAALETGGVLVSNEIKISIEAQARAQIEEAERKS
jgi:polyisoprenoid-binding protein YceI